MITSWIAIRITKSLIFKNPKTDSSSAEMIAAFWLAESGIPRLVPPTALAEMIRSGVSDRLPPPGQRVRPAGAFPTCVHPRVGVIGVRNAGRRSRNERRIRAAARPPRDRPATAPHPTLDRPGVQPTPPPEWVVDGLGNVVTDRSGTPLRVLPGHHTEIDPRTLKVWVIPNGQRMFRLERTGPMNETGGSHRQPGLLAEAKAWFREGRNDLANAILKAFPDSMTLGREVGAPGTPTQGEIFQDRMGHGLDAASDVVALTPAPAPDQQQHNTRHRSGRG